jgi:hypothetical protein
VGASSGLGAGSMPDQAGFLRDTPPVGSSIGSLTVGGTTDYRFSGGKLAYAGVLSTAGDNVVVTPGATQRVRLFWVAFIPNSDNSTANLVTVKAGATTYYVGYALAHWEVFDGPVNTPLVVNLANAQPVAVTIHYTLV